MEGEAELDSRALIRGLIRISSILSGTGPVEPRLRQLCMETASLLRCDRSSIMLWDGEVYRATYNWGNPPDIAKVFEKHTIKVHDPVVAEMHNSRSYVVINNARQHRFTERIAQVAGIQSLVVAPMFERDGTPLGFITAEFNEQLGFFDEPRAEIVLGVASLAQTEILVHREQTERQRAQAGRRRLLDELVAVEDRERSRLGREIHDDPLQRLFSMILKLQIAHTAASEPEARALLEDLITDGQAAANSLRNVLKETHPAVLGMEGLATSVGNSLARRASQAGWEFILRNDLVEDPPARVSTVMFRIAEQAMQNAALHAKASNVVLALQTVRRGTSLMVSDDGCGFEATSLFRQDTWD